MTDILEDVQIVGQDHKGRGIVRNLDKIIFVDKALPKEICDIKITKDVKKFQEAGVISYKKKRGIDVSCPYYNLCGGCDILHQKYNEQLKFKENKVKEIMKKFAGLDIKINPIIYDESKHYRNKITLHNLGLNQKKSNKVVNIDACLLVHPKINEIIKRLIEYSKNSNNIIEEAMIRVSNKDEILLKISGKIQRSRCKQIFEDIDVLIINDSIMTSKDVIYDEILGEIFAVSSASFYQVNRFVTSKLYQEVLNFYKDNKVKNVLDLYCGVGTISLLVSPYVENVTGIEVVKDAIDNANKNKGLNNIDNVKFICGKVENYIKDFENIDSIIVDPPRSGLDSKTSQHLLKILPDSIVYVSCDPVTLARDIKLLSERYEVKSITPVDMFPNTYHVECVCVLRCKKHR